MNKLENILIAIIVVLFTGVALASTVSTIDGVNFNVTNDAGFTVSMTNQQIMGKVNQFQMAINRDTQAISRDSQQYLSDQETYIVWNGVEQMAQQSKAQITNSTGN